MRPRAVKSRSGVTARKHQTRIYTWTTLLSPHALRHRSQPQCHLAWPTRTPASFLHCLFVRSSLGPVNSSGTGCALAQPHVACPLLPAPGTSLPMGLCCHPTATLSSSNTLIRAPGASGTKQAFGCVCSLVDGGRYIHFPRSLKHWCSGPQPVLWNPLRVPQRLMCRTCQIS